MSASVTSPINIAQFHALDRAEALAQSIKVAQTAPSAPIPTKSRAGGFRHVCRSLGIERTQAARALAIDSLAPNAKAAARLCGLDNNAALLLATAKLPPREQAEYLMGAADLNQSKQKAAKSRREAARQLAWVIVSNFSDAQILEWTKAFEAGGATVEIVRSV